jgi:CheY-like chemotaxis protein
MENSMLDDMLRTDAPILPSRLLVVDDDPALLVALSGTLHNRLDDCTIDACESGMQALELVKTRRYDTIISDVTMPGMSGWQFLRAVRQCRSDTPVFLMSGNAGPVVRTQALESGAVGFFAKPFDRDAFVATVRKGLELFRLTRFLAIEDAVIRRAKSLHETLVEKLHQHDGAYARLDASADVPERGQPMDKPLQRRTQYRSTMLRQMSGLDKFLTILAGIHSRTLNRQRAVQKSCTVTLQHDS